MNNKENALKVIRYIQSNTGGKELNHLLLEMRASKELLDARLDLGIGKDKPFITGLYSNAFDFYELYDLANSVQENLESNPELTNYFINLFGL